MSAVAFHTLGCKVNHYETEGVWELFKNHGYKRVNFDQLADVYIINTCTVTNNGDKKSRQIIRRAIKLNPSAVIVVMGCYSQISTPDILKIPGVDIIIGTEGKNKIYDYVEEFINNKKSVNNVTDIMKVKDFEELDVFNFSDRIRATIKIQEGCNNFCTYCIIPWARGLSRSRNSINILNQAKQLVMNGYKEIVLTGIHTGAYGEDLDNYSLSKLLQDLELIAGLKRIRISSIEVTQIDDIFLEVLGKSSKITKHLHIPLQAGDDEILRKMKRNYTTYQFQEKIIKIREVLSDVAITTDVITGFPGESEDNYINGYNFINEINFSELHVFSYSKRSGTPAAIMKEQVSEEEKHRRAKELINLSNKLAIDYRELFLDKYLEVIPEVSNKNNLSKGFLMGHSDNYIPVIFKGDKDLIGELCTIRLDEIKSDICKGTFVKI